MIAYHNPGTKRKIMMINEDELEDIRSKSSFEAI